MRHARKLISLRMVIPLLLVVALACGGASAPTADTSAPSDTTAPTDTSAPSDTAAPADTPAITGTSTPGTDEAIDLSDEAQFTALVEAAKLEGPVMWYTVNATATADRLAAMFEDEYGIPVTVYRAGGEEILQRYAVEAESGRVAADVVSFGPDVASTTVLANDGHFRCDYELRNVDDMHDRVKSDDGCWYGERMTVSIMAYRADLLDEKGIEPLTGWGDLTNPEFRGQVYIAHPGYGATTKMAITLLAEAMGWEWFEQLRENELIVVRNQAQMVDALELGEALAVGPANQSRLLQAKAGGLPIEILLPQEGTFLAPSPNMIPVEAPNPNAALLFADFLLTDAAQEVFVETGNLPARVSFPNPEGMPPIDDAAIFDVDWEWMIDNADDAVSQFAELFGAGQE